MKRLFDCNEKAIVGGRADPNDFRARPKRLLFVLLIKQNKRYDITLGIVLMDLDGNYWKQDWYK